MPYPSMNSSHTQNASHPSPSHPPPSKPPSPPKRQTKNQQTTRTRQQQWLMAREQQPLPPSPRDKMLAVKLRRLVLVANKTLVSLRSSQAICSLRLVNRFNHDSCHGPTRIAWLQAR